MKQVELRQFASLTGTQGFLDTHSDLFGNINASNVRKRLDEIVQTVQDRFTVQLAGTHTSRGTTEGRAGLEQDLRKGHMMPIAEYARAKMKGLGEGEFKDLTPSAADLKGARLVQAALAMATVANVHLDDLEADQFPSDVVTQLVAAANAVQASLSRRHAVNVQAGQATKDILSGLAEGRALVRTIGAVVKRTSYKNPGLLAAWRLAQRVRNKPGVPDRPAPVVGSTTPAGPTVQTRTARQVQEVKQAA